MAVQPHAGGTTCSAITLTAQIRTGLYEILDQRVGCDRLFGGPECAVYFLLEVAIVARPTIGIVITPAVE